MGRADEGQEPTPSSLARPEISRAPAVLQPGQTLEGVDIAMQVIRPIKLGVLAQLPVQLPPPETGETPPDVPPPPGSPNQPIVHTHLTDAPGNSDTMTNMFGWLPPGGRYDGPVDETGVGKCPSC